MESIPKFFIVSSDDEFSSIEWTADYFDQLKGEKHLIIVPNTEHSLMDAFDLLYSTLGQFVRSIAKGEKSRPTFNYQVNKETAELSVTIPKDQAQPESVQLRYAETLSNKMRDFRWEVMADANDTCTPPLLPSKSKAKESSNLRNGETTCSQPITWLSKELRKSGLTSNGDAIYET
jgi:PhoPQ-activated pathogenicity-related protein